MDYADIDVAIGAANQGVRHEQKPASLAEMSICKSVS
jgi:hypothetical protein